MSGPAKVVDRELEIEIEIDGFGYGGEGFARTDQGFVSLPRALPGERVVARLGPFRRGRAWGEVVEWLQRSPRRVEPDCPHFGACSGCALRHLSRADERAFKLDQAREILARYGPRDLPAGALDDLEWIGGEDRLGHRARGRFAVAVDEGRSVRLGLRSIGLSREVVDVRDCPAQSEPFRALMTRVGEVLDGALERGHRLDGLTAVAIETTRESARITLHASARPDDAVLVALTELASLEGAELLLQIGDGEPLPPMPPSVAGRGVVGEGPAPPVPFTIAHSGRPADHLTVRVPPGSWHHAAPELGHLLVNWVAEQVTATGARRVLDLCCGIGTIAARLSASVDWMMAVDEHRPSVEALRDALADAWIEHVQCRAGRIGAVLRKLRRDPDARAELAVINPMRRPLGNRQLRDLPPLGVEHVVYVGPAPVSAARDVVVLDRLGYRLEQAAVVDLHPGTAQLMLALVLRRRRNDDGAG